MTEQIAQIIGIAALGAFYWFAFIALASTYDHHRETLTRVVILGLGGMSMVAATGATCIAVGRTISLFF